MALLTLIILILGLKKKIINQCFSACQKILAKLDAHLITWKFLEISIH